MAVQRAPGGRFEWIAPAVLAAALATPSVGRAEPARVFRLPSEPIDIALVRFGIQAGVSVGGFPAAGCDGRSRPLLGVFTASSALARLLPAGCRFERLDARAFRISGASAAVRPPAPPQAPSSVEITELVVTAEKRREPLRGSPFAVTAVGGDTLERTGAGSFAEAALQIAGVTETNLGPGRNKIFIRGISDGAFTGRTQSTVGLYLDDVPITYNAPDPDLRLADIERVEVLRGPQGTLYGSGSIGGIVRLVTARPDVTGFRARMVAEGMLNAHADRSFGGEAMINVPVVKGRAAVRAVAYVDELSGYLDNPSLRLEDVNRGRRSGGRVSALADLGGGWTVQAAAVRQGIETSDSQYVQGAGRRSRDTRVREPHDNDFKLASLSFGHAGSTADVRVSGAYIDHDLETRYDATGAFDLAADRIAAVDEQQRVELLVGEAVATSAAESRLRWLAGAFVSHSREMNAAVLDATLSGGDRRSVFERHDHLTETAVFGELTYDLTHRLTATGGGRLFRTRVETRADRFGLTNAGPAIIRGEDTDSGFAPKLRLSYAVSPDIVAYAQAQDGYRAGGFNVPAQADGVPGGPDVRAFGPDRLRSYEVGGEATLLDRRLTVRVAAFRARWRDVQTDQFRDSGLPVTLNIGDGSNTGLEFEAQWRPDAHWLARVSGLLGDPELTRTEAAFPARVDIGLPGVAKASGAVDLAYRWDVARGVRVELSGQAAYVGRSFLTFDGASASAMGDYLQGRIAASLRTRSWEGQAYVANVTGARGDTFAFGNPFSRSRARQATPLPPRTFGLAIRRSF
ncbi:MAG: TonB-dependent receptor [Phenylobacterium sp.]|nr:TonB-dependent receptor [Phenylobacterium sp.]